MSRASTFGFALFTAIAVSVPDRSGAQSLRGFADIHNHQFANYAFGGMIVVGHAYGAIGDALSQSLDVQHHGTNHSRDHFGFILSQGHAPVAGYPNAGFPTFAGWPSYREVTHQKVHHDWLRRAVDGGMRLMVMLAVDSPALCSIVENDGRECADETGAIDRQIEAAYAMQDYVDRLAGGPGRGWYRIVTSPGEARRVIATGQLAIVLGIETAHPFGCRTGAPCNWPAHLDRYWARGVRHFYPVHQADNAFGSASYFQPFIQAQRNYLATQPLRLISPYTLTTRPCPQYARGRCNANGLTATGRALIHELMRRGAMIDIDHMSDIGFGEVLSIAESLKYPVVASHAGFNYINNHAQDHEGQLTGAELQRIAALGGIVGLISGQGSGSEVDAWRRPGRHEVPHVCGGTSETFAQAYYYARDAAPGLAIAIGTDFNGPVIQPRPRFGSPPCTGSRLPYPFLARASSVQLARLQSGSRTFNYNEDGLAHVGLLPDLIADLEVLGIPPADLDPLLTSAVGYIQSWERAMRRSVAAQRAALLLLFGNE